MGTTLSYWSARYLPNILGKSLRTMAAVSSPLLYLPGLLLAPGLLWRLLRYFSPEPPGCNFGQASSRQQPTKLAPRPTQPHACFKSSTTHVSGGDVSPAVAAHPPFQCGVHPNFPSRPPPLPIPTPRAWMRRASDRLACIQITRSKDDQTSFPSPSALPTLANFT